MTLIDLITDAYRMAGIIAESDTPSAEQGAMAVTRLNDLIAELESDGIDLGWNPKSSTTDTASFPEGYVGGIKAMLAVLLFVQYMGPAVPPVLAATADSAYERMLRQATILQNTEVSMRGMSLGASSGYWRDITR